VIGNSWQLAMLALCTCQGHALHDVRGVHHQILHRKCGRHSVHSMWVWLHRTAAYHDLMLGLGLGHQAAHFVRPWLVGASKLVGQHDGTTTLQPEMTAHTPAHCCQVPHHSTDLGPKGTGDHQSRGSGEQGKGMMGGSASLEGVTVQDRASEYKRVR